MKIQPPHFLVAVAAILAVVALTFTISADIGRTRGAMSQAFMWRAPPDTPARDWPIVITVPPPAVAGE